ncbi:MAG: hypothetical protein MJ164_03215, partial [Alphaproteobacteria bacterium]|nr:hypothetical protein [Alphaproteobacteria bacterium]
ADKFLVRRWVARKIGKKYLIPLLGVYDYFDEIDFDKLPNEFVIKCNHGSGYNIIVSDKSKLDLDDARKKINSWMSEDFAFKNGCELHYHNIKHKIIIEEYIDPSLSNYEIQLWTFNGKIKFVSVETNKTEDVLCRGVFYPNGKQCEFQVTPSHYKNMNFIPCIKSFKKALKIGKKLLLKTPYVRIDFIDLKGDIKFREMTFTSGSGLSKIVPEIYTNMLGDWIKLPCHEYDIETGKYRLARRDMKYNISIPVIKYSKHDNKIKLNIFGAQVFKLKNTEKDYIIYLFGLQVYKRHISNGYAKINVCGIRVWKYKL